MFHEHIPLFISLTNLHEQYAIHHVVTCLCKFNVGKALLIDWYSSNSNNKYVDVNVYVCMSRLGHVHVHEKHYI